MAAATLANSRCRCTALPQRMAPPPPTTQQGMLTADIYWNGRHSGLPPPLHSDIPSCLHCLPLPYHYQRLPAFAPTFSYSPDMGQMFVYLPRFYPGRFTWAFTQHCIWLRLSPHTPHCTLHPSYTHSLLHWRRRNPPSHADGTGRQATTRHGLRTPHTHYPTTHATYTLQHHTAPTYTHTFVAPALRPHPHPFPPRAHFHISPSGCPHPTTPMPRLPTVPFTHCHWTTAGGQFLPRTWCRPSWTDEKWATALCDHFALPGFLAPPATLRTFFIC